MSDEKMVTEKSWDEFRATGLIWLVNTLLHVSGWAIVFDIDDDTKECTRCFPARVRFRGFSDEVTEEAHKRIGEYMKQNAEVLAEETKL